MPIGRRSFHGVLAVRNLCAADAPLGALEGILVPPDLVAATPWYFLPKSIDILFQQLLVLALVLALSAKRFSLRRISIYRAAMFGSVHVLLAFGGVPFGYVIRFMISAAAFGFLFPYLLLRVPNWLAYSYVIHWLYYALSVVMPHVFLASAK